MNTKTVSNSLESEEAFLARMALQHLKNTECEVDSGYTEELYGPETDQTGRTYITGTLVITQPIYALHRSTDVNVGSTKWISFHDAVIANYQAASYDIETGYHPLPENLNSYIEELSDESDNTIVEPNYRICTPSIIKQKISVKLECIGKIKPNPRLEPEWAQF